MSDKEDAYQDYLKETAYQDYLARHTGDAGKYGAISAAPVSFSDVAKAGAQTMAQEVGYPGGYLRSKIADLIGAKTPPGFDITKARNNQSPFPDTAQYMAANGVGKLGQIKDIFPSLPENSAWNFTGRGAVGNVADAVTDPLMYVDQAAQPFIKKIAADQTAKQVLRDAAMKGAENVETDSMLGRLKDAGINLLTGKPSSILQREGERLRVGSDQFKEIINGMTPSKQAGAPDVFYRYKIRGTPEDIYNGILDNTKKLHAEQRGMEDLAASRGASVDVNDVVTPIRDKVDELVKTGRITKEQGEQAYDALTKSKTSAPSGEFAMPKPGAGPLDKDAAGFMPPPKGGPVMGEVKPPEALMDEVPREKFTPAEVRQWKTDFARKIDFGNIPKGPMDELHRTAEQSARDAVVDSIGSVEKPGENLAEQYAAKNKDWGTLLEAEKPAGRMRSVSKRGSPATAADVQGAVTQGVEALLGGAGLTHAMGLWGNATLGGRIPSIFPELAAAGAFAGHQGYKELTGPRASLYGDILRRTAENPAAGPLMDSAYRNALIDQGKDLKNEQKR